MAQGGNDFDALMQRIREGSQEAAQELFEIYGPHLFRVVRRQLHRTMRSKYDSADFVQAVWASFFAVEPEKTHFDTPEALISYLAKIARNKVIDAVRQRFGTIKYNVGRERSLEAAEMFNQRRVVSREPSPSQVVRAKERKDQIMARLSEAQQPIVALVLEGYTHREIAEKLGLNERTIRRVLHKVTPGSWIHGGRPVGPLPSAAIDTADQ